VPRKQRVVKHRREDDTLRIEVLDMLLEDFPSHAEMDAMNADSPGAYDPFHEFDFSLADRARLRVQHRDALIAEAIRRGLSADHLDRVCVDMEDEQRLARGER
jgi:hypothetical protein